MKSLTFLELLKAYAQLFALLLHIVNGAIL